MKKKNIKGLHIIMAANEKGGASKSTTIAETAAGLKQLGVPTIVVNIEAEDDNQDTTNRRLKRMLRGSNVVNVSCEDSDAVSVGFGEVLDFAEDNGAVILLDVPAAMSSSGNKIWTNLLASSYFDELDSFTLIGVVTNEEDHFENALHITNKVCHPCKHIMYRGWSNPGHNVKLENMALWKKVAATYPSIVMPARNDGEEAVVIGKEPYEELPGLILLPEWYREHGLSLRRPMRNRIQHVVRAIDLMADFLKVNYLPIICDSGKTTD